VGCWNVEKIDNFRQEYSCLILHCPRMYQREIERGGGRTRESEGWEGWSLRHLTFLSSYICLFWCSCWNNKNNAWCQNRLRLMWLYRPRLRVILMIDDWWGWLTIDGDDWRLMAMMDDWWIWCWWWRWTRIFDECVLFDKFIQRCVFMSSYSSNVQQVSKLCGCSTIYYM